MRLAIALSKPLMAFSTHLTLLIAAWPNRSADGSYWCIHAAAAATTAAAASQMLMQTRKPFCCKVHTGQDHALCA
jgi:hypothetical protein